MRRSSGFSSLLTLLRAVSVAVVFATLAVSCFDSTGPNPYALPPGISYIRVDGSDSAKAAFVSLAPDALSSAPSPSATVVTSSGASFSTSIPGFKYMKSHPAFAPEAIPNIIVPQDSLSDDGLLAGVPLGFHFDFYGVTYDSLNIYMNGFITFGSPVRDPLGLGFFRGDQIPNTGNPNNLIAFAWTDWNPKKVVGGVRFETRGTAPHRRFLLQFNNVPEALGRGLLMMQLVLNESTNDITIYTNTMNITNSGDRVTQGIENSDGTAAAFDSVTNPINRVVSARVRGFFSLSNDAVRFTPPRPPVVNAPKDTVVPTEAASVPPQAASIGVQSTRVPTSPLGKCDALIDPGFATASSEAGIASVAGVRSDDGSLPLIGRYPKGNTTITWTAVDSNGVQVRASQLVTVVDKENPLIVVPGDLTADNDPHLPSAVVSAGAATADDNCHEVTVSSSRSDGAALDAPFMVGLTTVTWTATDGSGNSASAKQQVTVRDVESPTLAAPDSFSVNATSPGGAVVTYTLNATDNVAVASILCNRLSGTVFPIGDNTVECTASDAAGNTAKASFKVFVVDARAQMWNLMQYIRGLGLSEGVSNPLFNQVSAAYNDASLAQECKKLGDFLFMLSKKNQTIPSIGVTTMITDASRIMAVLGCGNAPDATQGNASQLNKS